jgi:hypothetical protein
MSHIVHRESGSGHGDLAEWELGLAQIGVALVSRVQFSQSQRLISTADAAQQVLCFSYLTLPDITQIVVALRWNREPFCYLFKYVVRTTV